MQCFLTGNNQVDDSSDSDSGGGGGSQVIGVTVVVVLLVVAIACIVGLVIWKLHKKSLKLQKNQWVIDSKILLAEWVFEDFFKNPHAHKSS